MERRKEGAARLSLIYNLVATALKLVAAALTGSIALFSEAAHSATDVVSSGLAYLGVRAAAAPPDEEHPYGHGKIETVVGFGEAVLLLVIVGYVAFESVTRLFHPAPVEHVELGIGAMALSAVTSGAVAAHVSRIGRETESAALQSNGQHLWLDALTSVGVLAGLAVQRLTGWSQADAVVALLFAVYLGTNAARMTRAAFQELIDRAVPEHEIVQIKQILADEPEMISYHRLRTRHSGSAHYVDVHVVVPRDWTVVRAHDLADRLEKRIEAALAPAVATIHVDPEGEEAALEIEGGSAREP